MRYYTEDEVRSFLPMAEAIHRIHDAFSALGRGEAKNQPRRRLTLESGAVLHSMAGAYREYFGTKVYSTHPKYGANFTFLLYEAGTARPLAQFEANWVGQIRTGAATGVAIDVLTKPDVTTLGIIGSGFQARSQLEAAVAVRPFKDIRIWSRDPEKRARLAASAGRAVGSAEEASEDADVLITATSSKDPVIRGDAIGEGTLVVAMGSNSPVRRELPSDLIKRSLIVADSIEQCRIEAGDLLLALSEAEWANVLDIGAIIAGSEKATRHGRPIVFKSVGLGVEDVAAASWIYERFIPARASADQHPAKH